MQFIQNHVKPHLFNQAHRLEKGYYAHQEFAHGVYGILEYYQELFQEKDIENIIKHLKTLKTNEFGKRTPCFCGEKAKFRKCHSDVFRMFKPLSSGFIEGEINKLTLLVK